MLGPALALDDKEEEAIGDEEDKEEGAADADMRGGGRVFV